MVIGILLIIGGLIPFFRSTEKQNRLLDEAGNDLLLSPTVVIDESEMPFVEPFIPSIREYQDVDVKRRKAGSLYVKGKMPEYSSTGDLLDIPAISNKAMVVRQDSLRRRYYVSFQNRKRREGEQRDTGVLHAIVRFFDADCIHRYVNQDPFWHGTLAPDGKPERRDIVFRANNEPQRLCIAIKKVSEKNLYVFSRRSYSQKGFDPYRDEFKLDEKTYYIYIRLSADNMDDYSCWVKMERRGKDDPKFTIISPPCDLAKEVEDDITKEEDKRKENSNPKSRASLKRTSSSLQ